MIHRNTHRIVTIVAAVALLGGAVALSKDKDRSTDMIVPGTVFNLSAESPKYVTADIEFRDPSGEKWPTFAYGKPEGKCYVSWDNENPGAAFTLACDKMAQNRGDQSRRVLGETIVDGEAPVVKFTVVKLGQTRTVEFEKTDSKGRTKIEQVRRTPAKCTVQIGERTPVAVEAEMEADYQLKQDNSLYLTFRFTVSGSELGLKRHTGEIECRAAVSAFLVDPDKRKKK